MACIIYIEGMACLQTGSPLSDEMYKWFGELSNGKDGRILGWRKNKSPKVTIPFLYDQCVCKAYCNVYTMCMYIFKITNVKVFYMTSK